MDDLELLTRWGEGDTAAGRALFERYYKPMYRFFSTKVGVGSEDLVQETFVACVVSRERFRADGSFRAFLYGTARNVLRYALRKARRGQIVDLEAHSVHDLGPSPSTMVTEKAEERLLLEALRRLPVDYQIAFELYYWEELTAPEMVEILGVSEAGVRSRIHRAKVELRRTMEAIAESPEVLESTATNLEAWAAQLKIAASLPQRT